MEKTRKECKNHSEQHAHPHDSAQNVTDPVCGMSTDRVDEFTRFDHQGIHYYFCSTHCLEKFKKNPEAFLDETAENPGEAGE